MSIAALPVEWIDRCSFASLPRPSYIYEILYPLTTTEHSKLGLNFIIFDDSVNKCNYYVVNEITDRSVNGPVNIGDILLKINEVGMIASQLNTKQTLQSIDDVLNAPESYITKTGSLTIKLYRPSSTSLSSLPSRIELQLASDSDKYVHV